MAQNDFKFDEIGYWSEIKLDIVKKYALAYSRIFHGTNQNKFYHVYIDAFSGAGTHISKTTGQFVLGSPLNALLIDPPFKEYHFIDLDGKKMDSLKERTKNRTNVSLYEGDCNNLLLDKVFPNVRYKDYRRALCLLDPYGLHLDWDVIKTAGLMKTIDIFLNFPIMDMNRNVLWNNPEGVSESNIKRMNAFWGDESWRNVAYEPQPTLFGPVDEKVDNKVIAEGFRKRLKEVAQFTYVPKPLAMRNNNGAIVYYLFFASQKPVAEDIVNNIYQKYKDHGIFSTVSY
ncbi:MAG: hypothetical protein IEMM0008_1856 [bacterium]|nr:MAG: hypothetical protein IEMM0008_1856 [bacterium]